MRTAELNCIVEVGGLLPTGVRSSGDVRVLRCWEEEPNQVKH